MQEELAELKKKSEEYLNNWKRSAADFANYKKEELERMTLLAGYAKENIFLHILPIIDSIYLAGEAFGKDGFMQIEKQIQEFLKKQGIEEIKAIGEKFNPETMETVEEVVSGSLTPAESGIVLEEVQKGYKMGDKVFRPAKVKISK